VAGPLPGHYWPSPSSWLGLRACWLLPFVMMMVPAVVLLVLLLLPAPSHAGCTVGEITCYATPKSVPALIVGAQHSFGTSTGLYPRYCAQLCADQGFRLAGLQGGSTCTCGDAVSANATTAAAAAHCGYPCLNFEQYSCGGPGYGFGDGRITVPPHGTPVPGETWVGEIHTGVFQVSCDDRLPPALPPAKRPALRNPCFGPDAQNATVRSMPFCDPSLTAAARARDIVQRLPLRMKVAMLSTVTPGAINGP
jgi:hypothetical protein